RDPRRWIFLLQDRLHASPAMNADDMLHIPATDLGRFLGKDALGILAAIDDVWRHDEEQLHLFLLDGAVAKQGAQVWHIPQTGNLVGDNVIAVGDHAAQHDGLAVVGHRRGFQVLDIENRARLPVAQADLLGVHVGNLRNDAHDHLTVQGDLGSHLENDADGLPVDVAGDDARGGHAAARVERDGLTDIDKGSLVVESHYLGIAEDLEPFLNFQGANQH